MIYKFRAWDKEEKNYIYFDALNGILSECDETYRQRNVGRFEQYNNINDKNNTEIYLGDYLEHPKIGIFEVIFDNGAFKLKLYKGKNIYYKSKLRSFDDYMSSSFQVIGNIHEGIKK